MNKLPNDSKFIVVVFMTKNLHIFAVQVIVAKLTDDFWNRRTVVLPPLELEIKIELNSAWLIDIFLKL